MSKRPIKLRLNDGRIVNVGDFVGDNLICPRYLSKHFLKLENSWAIDKEIVDDLLNKGLKQVTIVDKENNVIYETKAENFPEYGYVREHKHYRPQYFLPMGFWTKSERNEK